MQRVYPNSATSANSAKLYDEERLPAVAIEGCQLTPSTQSPLSSSHTPFRSPSPPLLLILRLLLSGQLVGATVWCQVALTRPKDDTLLTLVNSGNKLAIQYK